MGSRDGTGMILSMARDYASGKARQVAHVTVGQLLATSYDSMGTSNIVGQSTDVWEEKAGRLTSTISFNKSKNVDSQGHGMNRLRLGVESYIGVDRKSLKIDMMAYDLARTDIWVSITIFQSSICRLGVLKNFWKIYLTKPWIQLQSFKNKMSSISVLVYYNCD
ncbi:Uncharacterized protein Fot_32770 [Forsythia ovata]|uniref:Uncharacterized protein n=1 Tax=Forsythia ovata TaxID=205694 RepID=A0ABD1T993_9LAMI